MRGAFILITVTILTKISTPSIGGRSEIHIALPNPEIDVRIFAQGCCVAIIHIEQDEIPKALLIKQET